MKKLFQVRGELFFYDKRGQRKSFFLNERVWAENQAQAERKIHKKYFYKLCKSYKARFIEVFTHLLDIEEVNTKQLKLPFEK